MTQRYILRNLILTMLSAAVLLLAACGNEPAKEPDVPAATPPPAASTAGGAHTINFRVDPDPPAGGKDNTVHVTIMDATGKPVSDADVHMTITMPAMPEMKMPEMSNAADLKWNGSDYSGPIQISMAGGWNVVVEAKRGNEVLGTHKSSINAK
jgi:hypothetical protein